MKPNLKDNSDVKIELKEAHLTHIVEKRKDGSVLKIHKVHPSKLAWFKDGYIFGKDVNISTKDKPVSNFETIHDGDRFTKEKQRINKES